MYRRKPRQPSDLIDRLKRLRSTLRRRLLLFGICAVAAGGVGALLAIVTLDWALHLPAVLRVVVACGFVAGFALAVHNWIVRPLTAPLSISSLASYLDHRFPHLNDRLASTVQFLSCVGDDSPAMRARMISRTRDVLRTLPLAESLTLRPLLRGAGLMLLSLTGLTGVLVVQPLWMVVGVNRYLDPFAAAPWPTRVEIAPLTRDTLVAFGDSATVSLRVLRGQSSRLRALVHCADESGRAFTLAMNRGQDSVYTCNIENITSSLYVWLQAGDASTRDRPRVLRVVHPPVVSAVRARVLPPPYASDRPELRFDLAAESPHVIAGSRVEIEILMSKPPRTALDGPVARLQVVDGPPIPLRAAADPRRLYAALEVRQDLTLVPHVLDADGFANRDRPQWRIFAVEDAPPTVSLREPRGTLELTPAAELRVTAEALDDLGIALLGVQIHPGGDALAQELHFTSAAAEHAPAGRVLVRGLESWRIADLHAAAGNVLTLRAFARDNLPGGGDARIGWSAPLRIVVIDTATLVRRESQRLAQLESELRDQTLALELLADRIPSAGPQASVDSAPFVSALLHASAALGRVRDHARASADRLAAGGARDDSAHLRAELIAREVAAVLAGPLHDADELLAAAAITSDHVVPLRRALAEGARQLHALLRTLGEFNEFAAVVERIRELLDRQQAARRDDAAQPAPGRSLVAPAAADQARVDRAVRVQRLIGEDTERLLASMRRMVTGLQRGEPNAAAIDRVLRTASATDVVRAMFEAADALANQRDAAARTAQRAAEAGLGAMQDALVEERARRLIELAKALAGARAAVAQLLEDLRTLHQETRAAAQQRASDGALDDLGDRQFTLAGNVRQLAESWRRQPESVEYAGDLASAHEPLRQAAGALYERDTSRATADQQRAIDLLVALMDALADHAARARDESQRQQLARLHARIVSLHERQSEVNTQTGALVEQAAGTGSISRILGRKAAALARVQDDIRSEADAVRAELQDAVMFQFILERVVAHMAESSRALDDKRLDTALVDLQVRIAGDLATLIRALTDMRELPPPDAYVRASVRGETAGDGSTSGPPVPALAELLVLKALQQDLHARTAVQARDFDAQTANEDRVRDLRALADEQKALGRLARKLTEEALSHGRNQ